MVRIAKPATVPTNQSGIRPVVADIIFLFFIFVNTVCVDYMKPSGLIKDII